MTTHKVVKQDATMIALFRAMVRNEPTTAKTPAQPVAMPT